MYYTLFYLFEPPELCSDDALKNSERHYLEYRSGHFLSWPRSFTLFSAPENNQVITSITSLQRPFKSFPIHHQSPIDAKHASTPFVLRDSHIPEFFMLLNS
jgi:hypothetical protein